MQARPTSSVPAPSVPTQQDRGRLGDTLDRLIEQVRGLIPVDGVAFVVVDEQRRWVEAAAEWFASPDLREAILPAARRRYDPVRPGLVELAMERDRSLHLPRVDAWEAAPDLISATATVLGEVRAGRVWETLRSAAVVSCPVKTSLGRPIGVLLAASLAGPRALGSSEVRMLEVLASLSGLALEGVGMLEAEARRAREEVLLKRAGEAVSASLELDDVYRRVVEQAVVLTGARRALLTRLDPRANVLRPVAEVDGAIRPAGERIPLNRGALADVVRRRAAVLERDGTSVLPGGAAMHAPIALGPRIFGVLTVAHEDPERFSEQSLEHLSGLARSSAAAIANALDFQRERHIARALTLGFIPESLPEVPGYATGLLYAPAANEATGGDVYGAWTVPSGEVAVLVGDVAGKGVETAAMSAMARFFIEARSWDSASPATVLEQANSMLLSRLTRDTFVTAFLALLSPGRIRWSNAGHLPPLVVSGGIARLLAGRGLPLGIDASPGYGESELDLAEGDLLFAYTDGLIEARREGETYGLDRLTALVRDRAGTGSPERLARSVHDEVAAWAGGLSDDAVALVLMRRGLQT